MSKSVERFNLEKPAAIPATFRAPSRKLKAAVEQDKLDAPALALVRFSTFAVEHQANESLITFSTFAESRPHKFEAKVDRIMFDIPALAPLAFVRFCMRYPQDCKLHGMAFRPKWELTTARRGELIKVNRDVNRAIKPHENLSGVMTEEWLIAPREGDCNDYAVTKRHKLLALGWPSRSLLLAEVVIPSGEHHLVLVVRTRDDDLVLDNLYWSVRSVAQVHYQWVRAQQTKNPKFWSKIRVMRATRVAMVAH